jgi:hypothetical protein
MNVLRSIFHRLCPEATPELNVDSSLEENRQVEQEAEAGLSLGPKIDNLIDELIEIGHSDGFLSTKAGGKFDRNRQNIRARQIGQNLNEIGGLRLMKLAWWRVRFMLSPGPASRELDIIWNLVGNWKG